MYNLILIVWGFGQCKLRFRWFAIVFYSIASIAIIKILLYQSSSIRIIYMYIFSTLRTSVTCFTLMVHVDLSKCFVYWRHIFCIVWASEKILIWLIFVYIYNFLWDLYEFLFLYLKCSYMFIIFNFKFPVLTVC